VSDPARVRALLRRSIEFASAGRFAEARAELDEAVNAAPHLASLRLAAATVRFVLRDYQEAIDEIERAIALAPDAAAAALALQIELTRRLGWYHESLAALDRARALAPRRAALHLISAKLLLQKQSHGAALPHLDAAIALGPGPAPARLLIERAGALAALGRGREAVEAVHAAVARPSPDEPTLRIEIEIEIEIEAARILIEAGDLDAARALLVAALAADPRSAAAHARLAQLDLWAGDLHRVDELAAAALALDPELADAHRLEGAARVLRGDHLAARAALDRSIELDPEGYEAHFWRAEVRMRGGDRDGAYADLERGGALARGNLLVSRLLRLITSIRCSERSTSRHFQGDATLGEVLGAVTLLGADAEEIFAEGAPTRILELLEQTLRALGGNRTTTPTWITAQGRLARIDAPVAPRYASRAALERIAVEPADEVIRAFDEVIRAHPGSSLPLCYRGELHLWLGRYAEAREDFEQLLAVHPRTRWAYVGLTLLEILRGDPEAALAISARGVRQMSDTLGPAVYAARGEALRRLGQLDLARQDLSTAIGVNPTRISAWINLGLAHGEAGDVPAQVAVLARLKEQAGGLLSDASSCLGVRLWDGDDVAPSVIQSVLTRALEMMRGNRSSSSVTYFSQSGALRVVTQSPGRRGVMHARDADDLARLTSQLEARRAR
jgi:tetratricopeptide (TPR) repeat protein